MEEKVTVGEDRDESRAQAVAQVTRMDSEAQRKVTEAQARRQQTRREGSRTRSKRYSTFYSSKQITEVSTTMRITEDQGGNARGARPASQETAGPRRHPWVPCGPQGQVTWVVPAAARGAPPPPGPLIEHGVPFADRPALERVGRQVADLQAGELTHEVSEGHPGVPEQR